MFQATMSVMLCYGSPRQNEECFNRGIQQVIRGIFLFCRPTDWEGPSKETEMLAAFASGLEGDVGFRKGSQGLEEPKSSPGQWKGASSGSEEECVGRAWAREGPGERSRMWGGTGRGWGSRACGGAAARLVSAPGAPQQPSSLRGPGRGPSGPKTQLSVKRDMTPLWPRSTPLLPVPHLRRLSW